MKNLKPYLLALLLLGGGPALAGEPIDINKATAQELAGAIVGVGSEKARAIIADRNQNGPFKTVDELARVRGIGPKMIENSRKNLVVQ